MKTIDILRISGSAIRQQALRSALAILAVAIGVAAVTVVVAVGRGSQHQVQQQIDSLGSDLLMVRPGSASVGGVRLGTGTLTTLTQDDAAAIEREVESVAAAGVVWWAGGQAVRGNRNWNTRIHGADPQYLVARNRSVVRGRPLDDDDVERAAKVAFLGTRVVEELFGDEDPIGAAIRLRNVPFRVVGVLDVKGQTLTGQSEDDLIYIPVSTARVSFARTLEVRPRAVSAISGSERYAAVGSGGAEVVMSQAQPQSTLKEIRSGSVSAIYVKARDAEAVPAVEREVTALLRQRHRIYPGMQDDFRIRDLTVVARARKASTDAMAATLVATGGIALLVGGIGIMNIMLASVTERQREIGLRIALGARRSDVLRQFLAEATLLALVGGFAGVALGAAGTAAVEGWVDLPLSIEPPAVVVALIFATAVGILFGYYPARRAARLDPIEALKRE